MKILFRLEFFVLLVLVALIFPASGTAHTNTDQGQKDHAEGQSQLDRSSQDHTPAILTETLSDSDLGGQVRIDEQLGSVVALDTVFKDETGKEVKLESFFGKPVVLLPVYFSCTTVCGFLQADLAKVLN